jgi:hypothetical protein
MFHDNMGRNRFDLIAKIIKDFDPSLPALTGIESLPDCFFSGHALFQ